MNPKYQEVKRLNKRQKKFKKRYGRILKARKYREEDKLHFFKGMVSYMISHVEGPLYIKNLKRAFRISDYYYLSTFGRAWGPGPGKVLHQQFKSSCKFYKCIEVKENERSN